MLAQATDDLDDAVPLLAALLSIPSGDRYPPLDLSPQTQKERTLHALLAQVEGLALKQPVLIVWEDVQWADPTSRDFLDLTVDRTRSLPILLIITYRPEFAAPWVAGSQKVLRAAMVAFEQSRQPSRGARALSLRNPLVLPRAY